MVEFECKCCNFWSSISLYFTGGGVLAYCPVKRFYFLNRCLMPQICEDTNPLLQSASMPSSAVLWTNPLESFSKIKGHTLQWQVVPTLHARSPGGRHNIYALQGHTNLPDAQIFGKGNASKWKWPLESLSERACFARTRGPTSTWEKSRGLLWRAAFICHLRGHSNILLLLFGDVSVKGKYFWPCQHCRRTLDQPI